MRRHWPHLALAVGAAVAAFAFPLTSALPAGDALTARATSAILAALVCLALATWAGMARRTAIAVSAISAVVGVALLLKYFDALTGCVVDFDERAVIIGTVYTPDIQPYLQANPGLSAADRLFDAGGVPERVWTAESIRACRLLVGWAGLAAIPFLVTSAAALLRRGRYTLAARSHATVPPVTPSGSRPVYDAFISYRHVEPDRTAALALVETLEAHGLRVAIDARDFRPNEHFLSEMERCVKQSRFVLCLITPQYVQSDHTAEEAIISKTLDLAERSRRLVPLIFERVELPVWLHGLVGIDFTPAATVDPDERLLALLTRTRSEASPVQDSAG